MCIFAKVFGERVSSLLLLPLFARLPLVIAILIIIVVDGVRVTLMIFFLVFNVIVVAVIIFVIVVNSGYSDSDSEISSLFIVAAITVYYHF